MLLITQFQKVLSIIRKAVDCIMLEYIDSSFESDNWLTFFNNRKLPFEFHHEYVTKFTTNKTELRKKIQMVMA